MRLKVKRKGQDERKKWADEENMKVGLSREDALCLSRMIFGGNLIVTMLR